MVYRSMKKRRLLVRSPTNSGITHHYMPGRLSANTLNKQSRTADKECSYSLGVGREANNLTQGKKKLVTKRYTGFRNLMV
jgi:hypothetical protein